jgi:hypothetical protein
MGEKAACDMAKLNPKGESQNLPAARRGAALR